MPATDLACRCDDGVDILATWHAPASAPIAALVVAPGMGIPRRYYARFAADLAARGIATLAFDYRGIGPGASALADPKGTSFQDWGRRDLHAALGEAFGRYPGLPVFHCGHSAGAQLVGLTPHAEKLAGLVFVAGPRPHASQDRGAYRVFSTLWWYVIVPLGSLGRWFPARRLGFSSVDVPAGVTAEWGRWARAPRYLFSPRFGIDTARYPRLGQPLLAWSFSDDRYAPRASIEALLSEFPAAQVTRRHLRPQDVGARGIGHLGFFREAFRDTLWRETADWIERHARAG